MSTPEKTEGKLSPEALTKNAGLISAAHRAIVAAGKTQLEKAIDAGTMLKACKDSVGHGEWSKWLHENCRDISEETARLYMRLAVPGNAWKLEAEAAQNGNAVADLSIRSAAKLVSGLTDEQKAARKAAGDQTRAVKAKMAEDALIPKKLKAMKVDDVVALLTKTFDLDELDTLVEALQKHLKEESPALTPPSRTPPPANGFVPPAATGAGGAAGTGSFKRQI